MNFSVFKLLFFVLLSVVLRQSAADMPKVPGMPDAGKMGDMVPPEVGEHMETAKGFKDMAMSQIPGADSIPSK